MVDAATSSFPPDQRQNVLLNDFAIRSFRDIADYDYIAARLCYRSQLVPQFLWSALQAIEKYLKCILLLNRIPARDIGHELSRALDRINSKAPFKITLSPACLEVMTHLDTYGQVRYMETPYYIREFILQKFDRTVWEIRRYATVLNYEVSTPDGSKRKMLDLELERINESRQKPFQKFKFVPGGELEKIVANRKHPAREPLIWNNLCFGIKLRRRIKVAPYLHATNSPLSLHPELLNVVLKYVRIPKSVVQTHRDDSASSENTGS